MMIMTLFHSCFGREHLCLFRILGVCDGVGHGSGVSFLVWADVYYFQIEDQTPVE